MQFISWAMENFHNFQIPKMSFEMYVFFCYSSWRLQTLGIGFTSRILPAFRSMYFFQGSFK